MESYVLKQLEVCSLNIEQMNNTVLSTFFTL